MATEKHRVSLSYDSIKELTTFLKSNPSIKFNRKLMVAFLAIEKKRIEIDAGIATAAFVVRDSKDVENGLGFASKDELSPSEKRKVAFDKWSIDPHSVTIDEMDLVRTYQMEHGLVPAQNSETEADIIYAEMLRMQEAMANRK